MISLPGAYERKRLKYENGGFEMIWLVIPINRAILTRVRHGAMCLSVEDVLEDIVLCVRT